MGVLLVIIITFFLIFIHNAPEKEDNAAIVWLLIIVSWIGCVLVLYITEIQHQAQLDGNNATIIFEDRITIPPRIIRRIIGRHDHIYRNQIDHVKIMRGNGGQYITKKEGVCWMGSPIGLKIITKSGKAYSLGYKPPSTVKEIIDVLTTHWNIRIEDPGSGMGRGLRYIRGKVLWELPYEDIMQMNLFEWQE